MTLPVPNLDSRTFENLVAEALRRVPRYTPDWTNHNDSDPGKALITLNAWLIETLLYQINQVPQQNYVAFLNLLGITPQPARAAATELTFTLKPLALPTDPLTVNLPAATRVAVDDPDLPTEVVFETGAAARALNGAVGLALVPGADGTWSPVTSYDSKAGVTTWLHAFDPFGAGNQFILALVLRPTITKPVEAYAEDRFPPGLLDLFVETTQVFDKDASGAIIPGPLVRAAGPIGLPGLAQPALVWEAFTGPQADKLDFGGTEYWEKLVAVDDSGTMTRSGHLGLDLPANLTPVPFDILPAAAWGKLGLIRPPVSFEDIKAALSTPEDDLGDRLRAALDEKKWALMGIPAARFNKVLSSCTTGKAAATALESAAKADGIVANPAAIPAAEWAKILPDFAGPSIPVAENAAKQQTYRKLYFLRATRTKTDTAPRLLNAIRLNTVAAVAASTRADETLGKSNGRPGQTFTLSRAPVWFDPKTETPDLELEVVQADNVETWTRVVDFFGQKPDATVFVLDPISGQVRFGDGRPGGIGGAIPPPGAIIRARRYRFGGGLLGNVGAGAVSKIKGALTGVAGVANLRAASGGDDAESFDHVLGRAPGTLRRQDRAMSAQDFADLAQATPGAAIHKAYAVAASEPSATGFTPRPGAVSVVVLPVRDHPTPQPTEAELAAVHCWLDPRRLVTTELFVTGPRYFAITRLAAQLRIEGTADIQTVDAAAKVAITEWLHPVRGGPDGTGWPFGTDIYHADIYDILLAVPAVRRVAKLAITHQSTLADAPDDVIPIPEGYLPALPPGALNFEVVYDRV